MSEIISIRSTSDAHTKKIAANLIQSIYTAPTYICFFGDIGVGKTTFIQGLLENHVEKNTIKSPTFALEHRYTIQPLEHSGINEVIHIDFYRLTPAEVNEFWKTIEVHTSLLCLEWSEKLPKLPENRIEVHIKEINDSEREIEIHFYDIPLLSVEKIHNWYAKFLLPQNVINHCAQVAHVANQIASSLIKSGVPVRQNAVTQAGLCHDLLRFIDFHRNPSSTPISEAETTIWSSIKEEFTDCGHEDAAAQFLKKYGYPEIGAIVRSHGGANPPPFNTIEKKIVYYADRRVKFDTIVSVMERHTDAVNRYYNGQETEQTLAELKKIQDLETYLILLGANIDL